MKQFDQIDGLCAKINELFNGAFWSNLSLDLLSTDILALTINQRVSSSNYPTDFSTYALTHFLYLKPLESQRKRFDFIYYVYDFSTFSKQHDQP